MSVNLSDQPTQKTKAFRHDINGLRAWAVIAVVLYHFGVPGFAGGFVGVDVFFVISGFLMTSIIISGLEQGRFSLWSFYLARARRIIPALLVLCVCLLIFGWFWLPSADYKILGTHAATALAFVSNLKFWREAGYFDAASHEKWLLHTWSLSVEWQFYILLPLGCLMLWHWLGRKAVKWALIAAGFLSLLLSIYASARWPGAAFYLLPPRAWEMLAGGLVWWATRTQPMPRQLALLAEVVGFALILISILCFDPAMQWPGYLALAPVLGAMLVLAAQRQNSFWTANYVARRLGASSYSIYLWHWPLVVALTYASEQHHPGWIGVGLLLTVVLGEVSLRWVENPARKWLTTLTNRQQIRAFVLAVGCLGFMAVGLRVAVDTKQPWMLERLNSAIELANNEMNNFNPRRDECHIGPGRGFESPLCSFGKGAIEAVVLGDSHANASVSAVAAAAPGTTVELTYSGCSTVLGLKRVAPNTKCSEFNDRAIELVNTDFSKQKIFVINRAAQAIFGGNEEEKPKLLAYFDKVYQSANDRLNKQFSDHFVDTMCSIKNPERVYLVRPYPEMGVDVPKTMARALMLGRSPPQISISLDEYHQRRQVIWAAQDEAARQCGVHILDPLPYFCHDDRCWGSKDGRPLYFDDDHLSEYGNSLLVPMFKQAWKKD